MNTIGKILATLLMMAFVWVGIPAAFIAIAVVSVNWFGIFGVIIAFGVSFYLLQFIMPAKWGGRGYDDKKRPSTYEPTEDAGGL